MNPTFQCIIANVDADDQKNKVSCTLPAVIPTPSVFLRTWLRSMVSLVSLQSSSSPRTTKMVFPTRVGEARLTLSASSMRNVALSVPLAVASMMRYVFSVLWLRCLLLHQGACFLGHLPHSMTRQLTRNFHVGWACCRIRRLGSQILRGCRRCQKCHPEGCIGCRDHCEACFKALHPRHGEDCERH